MCSCKAIAKLILVLINLIFLLAGSLMLAFGIVAKVKVEYIFVVLDMIPGISKVSSAFGLEGIIGSAAIFMIILGAVVAAVGFFGCCGACCENRALLIVYIVILVLVLCGEVALIIFAAVAPDKLKATIQDLMKKSQDEFREDITFANGTFKTPNNTISLGWTVLQLEAKCCGTYNYTDYKNWPHNVTFDGRTYVAQVPASCCLSSADFTLGSSDTSKSFFVNVTECLNGNYQYINQKNCYDSIHDLIRTSTSIAIGIAAGIIGLQLLLIVLSGILCHQQKNDVQK